MTQEQLAKKLGFSREQVSKWESLPGAPKARDPKVWAKFIDANDLGISSTSVSKSRETLLREKLTREIALLDVKIDKEKRNVVEWSVVDDLLLQIASRQRQRIYQLFVQELPPKQEGLATGALRELNRKSCDKVCDIMRDLVEEFKREAS